MNAPKISIVTVVRNAEQSLEQAILSVINQTYQNIEYIIIDGKSTDGTVNIIKKYEHEISYWVSEHDKGIYDAMNKALKVANGDWLYFLGADDILSSDQIITEMIKYFTNENVVYYGDVLFKTKNLRYKFNLSNWNICYRNISHQSIFYPKLCFRYNDYDLSYKVFADHIYNIKLYGLKRFKFEYINLVVAIYNDGGTSSNTYDINYYNHLPSIVRKFLGLKYAVYVKFRVSIFKYKFGLKSKSSLA